MTTTTQMLPITTSRQRLTATIKLLAADHGLAISRVTSADAFPGLAEMLERHIGDGHLAGLEWFTPERARVCAEPRRLMASAVTILSVGVAYWSVDPGKPDDEPRGRIARYAWGVDYHKLLKRRMKALHRAIEGEIGKQIEARHLVDHARIVDRAVAARAGVGWYGKHSCLIVPGHGSWVMLGELLLDLDLEPDAPIAKDCGRCTICLDRCPTGAIVAPYTVSTPLCLSFQTIEQRGAIPVELRAKMGDWVFGCDVCQDVCPYTKAARPEPDRDFLPKQVDHAYPSLRWLLRMSADEFRVTYQGMATLRTKRAGMARNAAVALGNVCGEQDIAHLMAAMATHDEPLVRGHAAWALGRLAERGVLNGDRRRNVMAILDRARTHDPDGGVRCEAERAAVMTGRE